MATISWISVRSGWSNDSEGFSPSWSDENGERLQGCPADFLEGSARCADPIVCPLTERRDFRGQNQAGRDLEDFDFSHAIVAGVDFSGSCLWMADFSRSDCTHTNFTRADLTFADFSLAVLEGANFSFADLCKANLRSAQLRGADLRAADLEQACLAEADLRGADLRETDLRGCRLAGAWIDETSQLPFSLEAARERGMLFKPVEAGR